MTEPQIEMTSFSHVAPYRRVTHAGGQYVLEEARVLHECLSSVFFAPETPDNLLAAQDVWADTVDVQVLSPNRSRWVTMLRSVRSTLDPYAWPIATGFARSAMTSDVVAQRLNKSDIVEIQWVEYFRLAGFVHSAAPNARVIGVAPDVVSQRIHRLMTTSGSRMARWFANSVRTVNRTREKRWFSALDVLIVLSEKDADLVRRINPTCRIEVVYPNLQESGMPHPDSQRQVDNKNVVFVGVFSRPENETAAVTLIEELWPQVLHKHPDATLTLVGIDPSDRMCTAASSQPSVEITGRVESIAPYYRSAHCVVVPLVNGAGVKFKTVSAMLWGVPIVSTHVGTEGIGPDDLFYAVSDTHDGLVDGMVRCLDDKAASCSAQHARQWANERYTAAQFRERMMGIYASS